MTLLASQGCEAFDPCNHPLNVSFPAFLALGTVLGMWKSNKYREEGKEGGREGNLPSISMQLERQCMKTDTGTRIMDS